MFGLLMNSRMPGCSPWTISARGTMAAEMPPGIPSTNTGNSNLPAVVRSLYGQAEAADVCFKIAEALRCGLRAFGN